MKFFSRIFKTHLKPTTEPGKRVMDMGDDPLNPRGDGTIREGDPMWDLMLRGKAMTANRGKDGNWEVEIIPDGNKRP